MGFVTEGLLGIVGGILLFVSIPISLVLFVMFYGIGMAPVYDVITDPAPISWLFIVTGIIIDAVSGLVLVIVGALLALGRGRMALAVIMIVFGVLGIMFSIASIGGIMGVIGGILGIVSGVLSIKEIKKQEATLLSTS